MSTLQISPMLTYTEVAKVLRVSTRQVRRMVDGGKLPFVQIGERSPRIRASDLAAFLSGNLVSRQV